MDFLRKIPQAALIIVASLAIVGVGVAIGFVTSDSEVALGAESGDRPAHRGYQERRCLGLTRLLCNRTSRRLELARH